MIKQISISALMSILLMLPASAATFSDVSSTYEFSYSIEKLHSDGVIDGYADGTFRPEQSINRAEFLKLVFNDLDPECTRGETFSDVEYTSWYAPYLCEALSSGIVQGYEDGTFRPGNNINFVEAAKILSKVYGEVGDDSTGEWYVPYVTFLSEANYIPTTIQSFGKEVTRADVSEMIFRLREKEGYLPAQKLENLTNLHEKYDTYRQWLVPYFTAEINAEEGALRGGFVQNPLLDCVSLASGGTDGGDILSSLIVDNAVRSLFNLKNYTPTVLAQIEYKVATQVQDKFGKNFYAFRVCKQPNNINVLSGRLWSEGDPSSSYGRPQLWGEQTPRLVAVTFGDNVQLYDVPALGRTATGGEPPQCEITPIDNDSIGWKCFMGLHWEGEPGESEFTSKIQDWILRSDGTTSMDEYYE